MNERTVTELLHDYAERRSEAAFSELVRRHIDLVHSAALRMLRDPHLAQDVTQAVFVALANKADRLLDRPVLSGWLHRTAQNVAANVVRTEVRRRAREQEAATMNELLAVPSEPDWDRIAPLLDEALGELAETDRDAILLRYFERKSARDMAQLLGLSDETAQKRVTRAVERMREYFAQRGVTMGASGLVAVISANAVQAAPAGLALTISSTAWAGATLATATATTAKTIAMTTLQKTFVAATITVLAGASIYEVRQASRLREQVASLRAEHAPLAKQLALLQREREDAAHQLALLRSVNADLKRDTADLPRLRGEVTQLKAKTAELMRSGQRGATNDQIEGVLRVWIDNAKELKTELQAQPGLVIPEIELLSLRHWLNAAIDFRVEDPDGLRNAASEIRSSAKVVLAMQMGNALRAFLNANNDELPTEVTQLKPYFDRPVTNEMLRRYRMTRRGKHSDLKPGTTVLSEIAPVDNDIHRIEVSVSGWYLYKWPQVEKSSTTNPAPK